MSFGLLPEGFLQKPQEDIRSDMNASVAQSLGIEASALGDATPLGKILAIYSERLASIWQLLKDVDSSQNPDEATGAALETLCALTGTLRDIATVSTVDVLCVGDNGTVITTGSQIKGTEENLFEAVNDGVLSGVSVWTSGIFATIGAIITNVGNIYYATNGGITATAPTGTGDAIVDGGVIWKYLGTGDAIATIPFQSVERGEIYAVPFSLDTIITPIGGWGGVANLLNAVPGQDIEKDAILRLRRETELAKSGACTVDAVYAKMSAIADVTRVRAFWNHTDVVDADGVPAHGVEMLIQGGNDQDIFDALLAYVGGGIETQGNTIGSAIDSEGVSHVREFSRPVELEIYVAITCTYDATLWPTDGDDQIKAAIITWGQAQITGKDVVSSAVASACFSVPGVLDVSLANIGTSAAPAFETTVAVALREQAVYDLTRITVTSSGATP